MNSEIILFIIGFVLGGGLIWFLRQKELDSVKQNQEEIKQAFGDLSNESSRINKALKNKNNKILRSDLQLKQRVTYSGL